jgi:hypothetical protein
MERFITRTGHPTGENESEASGEATHERNRVRGASKMRERSAYRSNAPVEVDPRRFCEGWVGILGPLPGAHFVVVAPISHPQRGHHWVAPRPLAWVGGAV